VLLQSRNKKDLEDVPESARKQVRFVWLHRVDDALAAALVPAGERDNGNSPAQESSSPARQAARSR
jgi:ATP-dependent Lon protease